MVGTTIAWVTCSTVDSPDPRVGLEAREVDDPPPGVERAEDRRDAGHVVARHADELRIILACAHELDRGEDVRREVPVAQHGGLRLTGGAAREQQHRDVVRIDERQRRVARPLRNAPSSPSAMASSCSRESTSMPSRPSKPASRSMTSGPATTTAGEMRRRTAPSWSSVRR